MEMFLCPLRTIQEKFTKSELVIMGWRSQEQAYKMHLRMKRPANPDEDQPAYRMKSDKSVGGKKEYKDADVPEGLPDNFFDEEGEVNLSKTTLKDAVMYMNAIGIKMPVPTPDRRSYAAKMKAQEESLPSMNEIFGE